MSDDMSNSGGGRIWQGLRGLLFGDRDASLRKQIKGAIDDHEGEGVADAKGDLSGVERQMLRNMLDFSERTAGDVAVPRSDIVAVPELISFAALVKAVAEAEHSRLPVYRDSLDTVTGMIHIKDVFRILASGETPPDSIAGLIRQPRYVPQSMGVLDLLAEMRASQTHLAIVLDEYSGTDGLITIEDLVEEIVGEIEDEHDDAPEPMLVSLDGGLWDADARAELEDVAALIDPRLGDVDGDVDTLGGLAFVLAGHVPQVGETVVHESGWRIEVTEGDARRAVRLRLHPAVERATVEQA
jgi:CBS domain containing-hemolysin-like protein